MPDAPNIFADLDRNCDDPCIAAGWALQQRYYDPNTSTIDKVEAEVMISWLYSTPLTIEQVYSHSTLASPSGQSPWAASLILDCLRTYAAPVNNSFLLINTDIAKRALEALL